MPMVLQPAGSRPAHASCPMCTPSVLPTQNQPWLSREQLGDIACESSGRSLTCLSVPADLGSSSVRAGLQSLETSGRLEDEFDMFALTRGSSLADQRKE